ncbi:MAG: hypothetical protein A2087_13255 [Spirochaetes bacterium GWD1_61_31]|nr:MAG: hypothetical protein A2Y37_02660 [Spirochaetes bacterium GWB1_60_80]OHD31325.1 MAG: hypothetical protein A2004_13535 [Spirochaetes bacterium GWC1_61_12]OHD39460.1 MAG: hypothetical protein A2087_13255 [Spirochaetes bacterium GWD1_61_31]OHD45512.1 MAG: hypothetical protein A2Y35_02930 [Spirochaetes bacterium GWE1_60_18]OHD58138.1 MAG: hypothetical protein A2Y32_05505 [Spirochaetes bacterium GWF1_60_12]
MDEQQVLERYLREHDLKMTKARQTILDAFLSMESHVTAEHLYEAVRQLDPGIGQATVFRNIRLFTDAGLAREACRDDGPRQYEHAWRHAHHDHLSCIQCDRVIEFVDGPIEAAQKAVYERYGFQPSGHRMELFGLCPDCAAKQRS